jgi:hypothetical protein
VAVVICSEEEIFYTVSMGKYTENTTHDYKFDELIIIAIISEKIIQQLK